jgi:hypothetical protein
MTSVEGTGAGLGLPQLVVNAIQVADITALENNIRFFIGGNIGY